VKTLRLVVDPHHLESPEAIAALERAAEILRGGGLVAMPTETVYGLGANALNAAAVASIFAAKQRPKWDPIIMHVASLEMLDGLVKEVPERARRLAKAYWPGPRTMLLPRTAAVPDVVTAGSPLVGVRMPAHPVALELIRRAGVPVAAPSANLFTHISPTTAAHVLQDLDGRIDAVLDAGATAFGVESTVMDPCQSPMMIYRPGAVTMDQIREAAGPVELFHDTGEEQETPRESLPSPGLSLRHYAPKARLVLVEGALSELGARLAEEAARWPEERLGILLPAGVPAPTGIAPEAVFAWGRWTAPKELASRLYAGLRALDDRGCGVILCPWPPAEGIGLATRDRLRRAAGRKRQGTGIRDQGSEKLPG
jgi:L-threonylcarbamoyladenylate synthase